MARSRRFSVSTGLVASYFFVLPMLILAAVQQQRPLVGIVTTKDGQPIAGVSVSGPESRVCCPFKRERTKTDEQGRFRLEMGGTVLRFIKEGFQPRIVVLGSASDKVRVVLEPSVDEMLLPLCGRVPKGYRRIGWGRYLLQFHVPRRGFKVSGGKPDVDYVAYLITPSTAGTGRLELWFGPYAMSSPEDDQFLESVDFAQRFIVDESGGGWGVDSKGQLPDGHLWRQISVAGNGAVYRKATAMEATLFDEIIDSACWAVPPRE